MYIYAYTYYYIIHITCIYLRIFTDTYRKDGLRVNAFVWRRQGELFQLLQEVEVPRKDRGQVALGEKERLSVCEGPTCYPSQHTATHSITLQQNATQLIATHRDILRHSATKCNATHCDTLRHSATHCDTLRHTTTHYNTLQHTAAHCSTLQHTCTRDSACGDLHSNFRASLS